MDAIPTPTRFNIWFRWIAANTASLAIAFFGLAALFGLSRPAGNPGGSPWAIVAGALGAALLIGWVMGALQWTILREFISHPRLWIGFTVAAWALIILVGIVLRWATLDGSQEEASLLPGLLLFALACGLLVGGAQWLVLRKYVPRAGLWVLANIAGLLFGLPFFFALGLPYGALTGVALIYLLRLPPA